MLKRQGLPLLIVGLIAALAFASTANAAATRAEYAAQANAVCEGAQAEGEKIVDKYFEITVNDPDSQKKINAKKFMRLWRNLYRDLMDLDQRAITGLAAITAAPGDEMLVADWIASMQRAHDLTFPAIKRTLAAYRFLLKADPYGGDDLSRGEKKKFKGHLRRINKANKPITAELKKADAMGLQLGATGCTEAGGNDLSARAALPAAG